MKNTIKNILYVCFSIVLLFACTTYEYEDPNNNAARILSFNSGDEAISGQEVKSRIETDTINFRDLSTFTNGRTWTFPEGAVDILGSDNDNTSDLQALSVIFKRIGKVDVVLTPDFKGPIAEDQKSKTTSFDVLPQIIANFTTDIPLINNTLQIEAGETGIFTNTSSELENAEWVFINNTTNKVSDTTKTINAEEPFSSLGSYTAWLRAYTETPFSEDFKTLNFKVIPSSKPVLVEPKIIENDKGEIIIKYSRDLNPATLDPISNFTLMVDGVQAPIASVKLQDDNLANLLVIPSRNIKNSQKATLVYNAVKLQSADAAAAPSIPITDIDLFSINLFANGVFEGIDGPTGDGQVYNTGNFLSSDRGDITVTLSPNTGINGSSAVVYNFASTSAADNNRTIFGDGQSGNEQKVEVLELGKTYTVRAMIKYTGAAPKEFKMTLSPLPWAGAGALSSATITTGFVEGEFVQLSTEYTPKDTTVTSRSGVTYVLLSFAGTGGESVVTIDNLEVFEKEL